ncbi:MAG: pyridoxamine 5'-phosphate oxidase family protein [Chloroflexi bacterium]|nr:pyridoxamine 5'-phosphate oxidase family protein [Chloroflexota bacterium]
MRTRSTGPKRDRPQLPHGYTHRGQKGMLAWEDAEKVLSGGRFYWIATTDVDGRPHLVQQWGAWVDRHLYFEGSERTRWARNLARDARIGFGTQSGTRSVMAEGTVDVVRAVEHALAERISRQYTTKYGRTFRYRPKAEQYETGYVFRVRPTKIVVFDLKAFSTSATRFVFP